MAYRLLLSGSHQNANPIQRTNPFTNAVLTFHSYEMNEQEQHDANAVTLALILLGLGWSAATVAGSALLTEASAEEVRTRRQGRNDFAMSLVAAVGAAGVGCMDDGRERRKPGAPWCAFEVEARAPPTAPHAPTCGPWGQKPRQRQAV